MAISVQGSSGLGLQGGAPLALQGSPVPLQSTAAPGVGQVLLNPSGRAAASSPAPAAPAGGGSTAATASADPNAIAYYADVINQLQTQINAARGQESTGLQNIDQAYNKSVDEQNRAESNAESGYATQRVQNGQQRETNVNGINDSARAAYDSLLGVLGASGAGVSSVARYGAPQAVAKDASGKRAGADTTYNSNNSSIDTAEGQTKESYATALQDLLSQKNSNAQNFESSLLNTEGTLEQQLRDAQINQSEYGGKSYATAAKGAGNTTAAVNNIQQHLADIFKQYAMPNFTVKPVTVSTPDMTKFSADPTTVSAAAANPTTDSAFLPYLQSLNKPNNVLTGPAAGGSAVTATAGAAR